MGQMGKRASEFVGEDYSGIRLSESDRSAEKIAELSQSITALFNNMPGLTFSKDAKTGVYLACNQAFAEYAHRANPSGVVGLTDYEIFDSVTASHFVKDDETALSMDEPYVFFEDVFDAAGNPRQFQTTKMQFHDATGRLCTLGMCVDVTDLMSARRATVEARRAYEEARDESITYYSIARALAADYLVIYYVDLETDSYVTYRHDTTQEDLLMDRRGEGFFSIGKSEMAERVYSADQETFLETFTKENVLRSVDESGSFTLTYRVFVEGEPTFMGLKASRIEGDGRHLVVGISNIDAQMRMQEGARRMREERATIRRITALSGDYLAVYTVDPSTGRYKEFQATAAARDYISLGEGSDFFEDFRRKSVEVVYQDDLKLVQSLLVRERILGEIETHGVFAMTFRFNLNDVPTYASLRAALVEERDGPQLIVGISNIDAQMKRDQELAVAQNRANQDALTGVRNKYAYSQAEAALNRKILSGEALEFGMAVFDVNNLKIANDTKGHRVGDTLLKQACTAICTVFKHSSVFRIGGDEFVAILQGSDYDHVDELRTEFDRVNGENAESDGAVVAWGVGIYRGNESVAAVFARADRAMYENKRRLKSQAY